MPLVDEETRKIILKKTWCHGQLILPAFSFLYLYLFIFQNHKVYFLYAAIVLPCWSYASYRAVFIRYSIRVLLIGGLLVELAHAGILIVALQSPSTSLGLLLIIASVLFLIETAAFLGVATLFRPPNEDERLCRDLDYQDRESPRYIVDPPYV
jgi:hypothetical protein